MPSRPPNCSASTWLVLGVVSTGANKTHEKMVRISPGALAVLPANLPGKYLAVTWHGPHGGKKA